MNIYLRLFLTMLPTVAASALLYLAERRMTLGKCGYWVRQGVAGLIFSALAILGTEFGVTLQGSTLNVRNAAPLCAGLIFGAPAGVIGGVERYFAAYWRAGAFTQLACAISTVTAGVLLAFSVTCVFTYAVQTKMAENESENLLSLNIADVRADITDASDENLLELTRAVAKSLNMIGQSTRGVLTSLALTYDVAEINVIDENGIITVSTENGLVGFDMRSGPQSQAFLSLLSGEKEYVQSYQPTSNDAAVSRKYAGVALENGGFVQVGYDAENFQRDIGARVIGVTRNRHVGEKGFLIICDRNWQVVSAPQGHEGESLNGTDVWNHIRTGREGECFTAQVYGENCVCMYSRAEGYFMIAVQPRDEAMLSRNVSVYIMIFMEVLIFSALFVVVYFLVKLRIVNQIHSVNGALAKITGATSM